MLQRIQTIWLLAAGICALLTIQFPYYSGINDPAIPYQQLSGKKRRHINIIDNYYYCRIEFLWL